MILSSICCCLRIVDFCSVNLFSFSAATFWSSAYSFLTLSACFFNSSILVVIDWIFSSLFMLASFFCNSISCNSSSDGPCKKCFSSCFFLCTPSCWACFSCFSCCESSGNLAFMFVVVLLLSSLLPIRVHCTSLLNVKISSCPSGIFSPISRFIWIRDWCRSLRNKSSPFLALSISSFSLAIRSAVGPAAWRRSTISRPIFLIVSSAIPFFTCSSKTSLFTLEIFSFKFIMVSCIWVIWSINCPTWSPLSSDIPALGTPECHIITDSSICMNTCYWKTRKRKWKRCHGVIAKSSKARLFPFRPERLSAL